MRMFKPSIRALVHTLTLTVLLTLAAVPSLVLERTAADLWTLKHSIPLTARTNSVVDKQELDTNDTILELKHDVNIISIAKQGRNVNSDAILELEHGIKIHPEWHPKLRRDRFPSVNQRVKIYMSQWYNPVCDVKLSNYIHMTPFSFENQTITWPSVTMSNPWNDSTSFRNETFDSIVISDEKFLLDQRVVQDCARTQQEYLTEGKRPSESRILKRWHMQPYCADSIELLNHFHNDNDVPILAVYGDHPGLHGGDAFDVPFFAKFRAAATGRDLEQVTGETLSSRFSSSLEPLKTTYHQEYYESRASPIIWKFVSGRHFGFLRNALKADTPWEKKKNLAIWRGAMTGRMMLPREIKEFKASNKFHQSLVYNQCRINQRCNFVLNHINSSVIDCGITDYQRNMTDVILNGTSLTKKPVDITTMQEYKVIISMEGNDISSGMKWMLQSQSVVLMAPPTRTSWAMEELLQPWVHYVPMLQDGSNAEEMVQWILKNDREAQRIAERATLFMYDMLYHPNAKQDEFDVKKEIARRYRNLWVDEANRVSLSTAKKLTLPSSLVIKSDSSDEADHTSLFDGRLYEPEFLHTNDLNANHNKPKIAWLMSFPNSGTSYTLQLTREASNTTTATNYGLEGEVRDMPSIPVFDSSIEGPFLEQIPNKAINMPSKYILTKTHCGGYCSDCRPKNYVETSRSFQISCQTGQRGIESDKGEMTTEFVTYDTSNLGKAIHLFRHPLDNIVARFHLHYNEQKALNNTDFAIRYQNNANGFNAWCEDETFWDELEKLRWIDDGLVEKLKAVPCRQEFFRYVQWHNLAFETSRSLSLPTLIMYYDDYSDDFALALKRLLTFLELPRVDGAIEPFSHGKEYRNYYTVEQHAAILDLVKELASAETWHYLKRYFPR